MQERDEQLIEQRSGYLDAIARVLVSARQSLCIQDRDLREWPIDSPSTIEVFTRLLHAGGSVRLVVNDDETLLRHAPRFAQLRLQFAERLQCRRAPPNLPATEALLIADHSSYLRRSSPESWRGRMVIAGPLDTEAWLRKFEALWLESEDLPPARPLGL